MQSVRTVRLLSVSVVLLLAGAGPALAKPDWEFDVPGGEIELDWDNPGRSLRFVTEDGNIDLRPGMRMHVDGVLTDSDQTNLDDDIDLRRWRLHLRGRLWKDWRFKFDGEFSPDRSVDWRNFWVSYRGFERVDIKAGSQWAPVGLEAQISSDALTFMERSLSHALHSGFQVGGSVRTWIPNGQITVAALANAMGRTQDIQRSQGWSFVTRTTYAPILDEDMVIHMGGSFEYRSLDGKSEYRIRSRPENRQTARLINTGRIPRVDDVLTWGFEAAVVYKSLSVQGEFLRSDLLRQGVNNAFDGGYAQVSWFPTGEMRPYSASYGSFRWIDPIRKWGAVELAGRWSRLDLNDRAVRGGQEDNWTVGVNYYLNSNIRFMFNAIFVNADLRTTGNGDRPQIYAGRFQLVF